MNTPMAEYVTYDLTCAICDKDMGIMHCPREQVRPEYCEDCKRAVRIAQMKDAGTLPKL